MKHAEVWDIMKVVIFSISGIVHCFGLYLLRKAVVRRGKKTFGSLQLFYLMNVSVCEIVIAIFLVIERFLFWMDAESLSHTLMQILDTGGMIWYAGTMILVTADRFLVVHWHLRYVALLTLRTIKIQFSVLISLAIISSIVYMTIPVSVGTIVSIRDCAWLLFSIFFLLATVFVYTYILRHVVSRKARTVGESHLRIHQQINVKKSFQVPLTIILTFCIFWVIPIQITFAGRFVNLGGAYSHQIWGYSVIVFGVGHVADATVYIFFQPTVFKVLKQLIKKKMS